MKYMNLYFYTFYRLYQRLQINPWGNFNYCLTIITFIVLEAWVLHCVLGNIALIFGHHIISDSVLIFYTPGAIVAASIFTYITIYRFNRGHTCIIIFDKWPKEKHKSAILLVKAITILLMVNSWWIVDQID